MEPDDGMGSLSVIIWLNYAFGMKGTFCSSGPVSITPRLEPVDFFAATWCYVGVQR